MKIVHIVYKPSSKDGGKVVELDVKRYDQCY